jgi:hypothetical protein
MLRGETAILRGEYGRQVHATCCDRGLCEDRTGGERTQATLRADPDPIRGYACGCHDEGCGAFYVIDTTRLIPTAPECRALLTAHNRNRKSSRTVR